MGERIVVTGMGTINPLGQSLSECWGNIINGISGVRPISSFDPSNLRVKIACEVREFNPEDYMSSRDARRRDRVEQFASAAAKLAVENSGIDFNQINPNRAGVFISSAIGGLQTLYDTFKTVHEKGPNRISAFAIPMLMSNGSASMVAIDYGLQGPCYSISSACASGSDAIGIAWLLLRSEIIDIAVAGASETTITAMGIATFDRVGAMSRRNHDFATTPQPFDLNRDGLVMGEGAGILVLETENHARKRGAEILAEIAGHGSSADAFHITAPCEDGAGGALAIRNALNAARVNPQEVDYINAHGTGTLLNDLSETRAIKAAFGKIAYNIPVSSTKSMTGHMMGATGALEAIICVLVINNDIIPATLNYQTPDPECDLDFVPNQARECPVNIVISNSFGFGGHNAVLMIRAYQ